MLNDLVFAQKEERDQMLSQTFVPREKLVIAQKFLHSPLIKVITGPRRAGKSVFAFQLLKNESFAYLNFDNPRLAEIKDCDALINSLKSIYPQANFFFFDEIQNLPNWELWANQLARTGHNLVISGSNAKLLSQEWATALTGRHFPIEIFPFSFREFLMASNISINQASKTYLLNYLNQYLVKGGFPEVVTKNLDAAGYLQTLTESILLKDVIKRHKIRRVEETYNLARYIFGNFSCQHSAGSVRRALNMRSVHTAQKYLRLLEEAYLLLPLNCFSYHFKRQIRAPQKIYLADTGFAAAAFTTSENLGRLMENAVFLELLRQGHRPNLDLFYYKQEGNKEVDFLVQEAGKITKLIQVCQTLADPKTKKRETRLLSGLGDGDTERVIITWEEEGASALPLYRFLLSSCQP